MTSLSLQTQNATPYNTAINTSNTCNYDSGNCRVY